MTILYKDFKLDKDDKAPFFNLSVKKIVNEGKDNEREEYQTLSYGVPFQTCIMVIIDYQVRNTDAEFTLAQFYEYYKELVEELGRELEIE